MKALSAKPVARVGGNGFWNTLIRLEAYKSQWALISNPGPLHESPLGINHNSFKIAGKATEPEKNKYTTWCFFKKTFSPPTVFWFHPSMFHPGLPCTMSIRLQLSGADSVARRNRDPSQHVTDFDQVLQAGRQKMWAFILLEVLKSILPEQASNLFTSILILPELPYAFKTWWISTW